MWRSANVAANVAGWLRAAPAGFAPDGLVLDTGASAAAVHPLLAHVDVGGLVPAQRLLQRSADSPQLDYAQHAVLAVAAPAVAAHAVLAVAAHAVAAHAVAAHAVAAHAVAAHAVAAHAVAAHAVAAHAVAAHAVVASAALLSAVAAAAYAAVAAAAVAAAAASAVAAATQPSVVADQLLLQPEASALWQAVQPCVNIYSSQNAP